jgi:DHA2 family methylenomycin A resistance protein-like MFS transporter
MHDTAAIEGRGRPVEISRDARLRLVACAAAAALLQIDGTIVTVALPSVGDELSVNPHSLSLVLTAYFVSYGLMLFPGGTLVDRVGSRLVALVGLGIFVVGAILGALAGAFGVLIAARVVQGVGAGLVSPASLAGAVSGFPRERRGAALGLWGASSGVANLIGPVIGGLLTVAIDWRACWWFLVLVAAVVAWAVMRFVPREVHADEMPEAAGLRQRVVGAAAAVAALTFIVMIGAFFIAQQYLQEAKGYSPLGAASALTVIAFLVGAGAPISGRLSDKYGERAAAMLGFGATALGLLVLGIPGVPLSGFGALPLLLPFGIGIGLLFVPASRAALNAVPQAKHGRVSSLLSTSRLLGAALGAGLAGLALTGGVTADNVHTALLVAGALCLFVGMPVAAELSPRAGRSALRESAP